VSHELIWESESGNTKVIQDMSSNKPLGWFLIRASGVLVMSVTGKFVALKKAREIEAENQREAPVVLPAEQRIIYYARILAQVEEMRLQAQAGIDTLREVRGKLRAGEEIKDSMLAPVESDLERMQRMLRHVATNTYQVAEGTYDEAFQDLEKQKLVESTLPAVVNFKASPKK